MNLNEAIALIQRRTGYRTNKADEIYDELVLAQERLEAGVEIIHNSVMFTFLPWFLVQEINTETTVVGEERVQVPPRFLKESEPDALWYFNEDADTTVGEVEWNALVKGDLDFLRRTYPTPGPPKAYALTGQYFRILPEPDDAYVLKILCYQGEQPLVESQPNATHLWLVHAGQLLCAEAMKEFAASIHDASALKWAESTFLREAHKLWMTTEGRIHANVSYVMGGDD